MREEFVKVPLFDSSLPFKIDLAGISYCDGTYKVCRQKAEEGCIEYIISGSGTVKTRGKVFYAAKGDSYFLKPDDDHEYYSSADDPWVKIWINISGTLVHALTDCYSLNDHTVFHCNSQPYIAKIHQELQNKTLSPNDIISKCSLYFHELIQFLASSIESSSVASPEAKILKDFIDTNIYSVITVEELSRLIFKSPSQTIRLFKKYYNTTPYEYHMNNRLKTAATLLRNTNFSVKEIAYKLNFCDEHYFSTLFKNKTGKKPTELRTR